MNLFNEDEEEEEDDDDEEDPDLGTDGVYTDPDGTN
jgi:hypothetical protein